MATGIAEVLFGILLLAVFLFLLTISITFDSVIGTKRSRPSRAEKKEKKQKQMQRTVREEVDDRVAA